METPCVITTYREVPDGQIATLTLHNPSQLNALTTEMQQQLAEQLRQVGETPAVRAVLLRGSGTRAFSSGGSMDSLDAVTSLAAAEAMYQRGTAILSALMDMTKPTVAAVSGWCIGGGFEIALACDLIYAGASARFGMTEVNNGLVPGWGGALRLPRRVNLARAKEMLLLGTKLTAQEAYFQGIINRVFPDHQLFSSVDGLLDQLAAKPPLAVQGIKKVLALSNLDAGYQGACQLAHDLSVGLAETQDFHEAIDAFRQKRTPHFQGK